MSKCKKKLQFELDTYCWHILTKSLSVVHCCRPLIYKFVFDNVSCTCCVPLGPIVVFVFVLLRLVLNVPLCEPVFDELLEFVLLGDAAVGTRWPYCKNNRKKNEITINLMLSFFILSIYCFFFLEITSFFFKYSIKVCSITWTTYMYLILVVFLKIN